MVAPRPRGRPLTPLELKHLRLLIEVRERAHQYARRYDEQLEDFVYELRDDSASTRSIAETLGVGTSTVQGWITNAKRRRTGG